MGPGRNRESVSRARAHKGFLLSASCVSFNNISGMLLYSYHYVGSTCLCVVWGGDRSSVTACVLDSCSLAKWRAEMSILTNQETEEGRVWGRGAQGRAGVLT